MLKQLYNSLFIFLILKLKLQLGHTVHRHNLYSSKWHGCICSMVRGNSLSHCIHDYANRLIEESSLLYPRARCGGAEVAGWNLDRKIRVRFPAYPHRVWALWWQGGKRRLRTSRCPCRGRLGTLKTPSCPWRGCPAAGQNLETRHLSRHYIAEISLNVTLNHNQQHLYPRRWQIQAHKGLFSVGNSRFVYFFRMSWVLHLWFHEVYIFWWAVLDPAIFSIT